MRLHSANRALSVITVFKWASIIQFPIDNLFLRVLDNSVRMRRFDGDEEIETQLHLSFASKKQVSHRNKKISVLSSYWEKIPACNGVYFNVYSPMLMLYLDLEKWQNFSGYLIIKKSQLFHAVILFSSQQENELTNLRKAV
ncbi:hypothetical protein CDAR_525441 [Caerostris darwini]|uniref:Uncharacterized protein n=1 Tax=Caerostris darwini TaxID=1538125 RepID=A0AAV4RLV4_9ARAC|nr:hypothetical protein CDAR_525441 [Caerostris darwini]